MSLERKVSLGRKQQPMKKKKSISHHVKKAGKKVKTKVQKHAKSAYEFMPHISMEMGELHDVMHDSDDEEGEAITFDEDGNLVLNEEAMKRHKALHGKRRKRKRGKFGGGNVNHDERFHAELEKGGTQDWDKDGDGELDWDELEDYLRAGITWTAKMVMMIISVISSCGGAFLGVSIIGDENKGGRYIVPLLALGGSIFGVLFGHCLLSTFCGKSTGTVGIDWNNIEAQGVKILQDVGDAVEDAVEDTMDVVFEDYTADDEKKNESKESKTSDKKKNGKEKTSESDHPKGFV